MKQLSDMKGICKYCVGCLRLEDENFESVYRCNNFEPTNENWRKLIEQEINK